MSKTHTMIMLACCLIGFGAVAAIFIFGVPTNTVFLGLMILICPLSHLFMMRFMGHGQAGHEGHDHSTQPQNELNRNAGNR